MIRTMIVVVALSAGEASVPVEHPHKIMTEEGIHLTWQQASYAVITILWLGGMSVWTKVNSNNITKLWDSVTRLQEKHK